MEIPVTLSELPWSDILASVFVIVAALMLRWAVVRMVRRDSETLSAEQRKWMSTAQNGTLLVIVVGLLAIWSLELSRVALSLAAFAVAIVIAGKEVIMCVTGGIYRAMAKPFDIGDWVEIGEFRGEVLREGLLTTRIQELAAEGDVAHAYTGRSMILPNAFLLTHPVIDLNFNKKFIFHTFSITVPEGTVDPVADLTAVESIVETEWQAHSKTALAYWEMVRRKSGVELSHPQPQVNMETTDICHVRFNICLFCPRETAAANETSVTKGVLAYFRTKQGIAED